MIHSNGLRSALYAHNPVHSSIQDRMDAVHKAQHAGKKSCFSVQNLDMFALFFKVFLDKQPILFYNVANYFIK